MTTSDVIGKTWAMLRGEHYAQPGTYERRIFAKAPFKVFAALERPSALPQLYFHFRLPLYELPQIEMRGVFLQGEVMAGDVLRVRLGLVAPAFEEVFAMLAADVVTKVLATTDEAAAFAMLVLRLAHWQRFLQSAGAQGLSQERQTGLFGELTFLRTLLNASEDHRTILQAWVGPQATNQDFSLDGGAVEVKTTTTNSLENVTIANEHQLDDAGLASLSLCHLCFDVRKNTGVTLPVLIDEINCMLADELQATFSDLLLQAGYVDEQKQLYSSRGYIERRRAFYSVSAGFPRIISGDLPDGVGQVRYELNTSGCTAYRIAETQVLKNFLCAYHDRH